MRETILILNFFINCVGVFSTVLETPKNLAVCVGQRTSFKCETSNESTVREWLFRNESSAGVKVFSNWAAFSVPTVEGYGVDVNSHGSGELFINETHLEHAGKYTCVTEISGKITHYYAELIVLETEPVCTVTKREGVTFGAECSVNFSGSWVPNLEWHQNKDIHINGISNTTSKTRVTSKVDAVTIKDTFTLSCTIRFSHSNWSNGTNDDGQTATNVPGYDYIWNANTESAPSGAPKTIGTTSDRPDEQKPASGGFFETNSMMMYVVAAMAFALILLTVVTLIYICRKRKRNSRSQDLPPEKGDEGTISKDRVYSGVYDTIVYDAIDGYEMPDHVFSLEGTNRYEMPFKDRVPSGYEDPDKVLKATDDEPVLLSSEYITTMPDPEKENILTPDRLSREPDNKYTPLNDIDTGKRKSEKNTSGKDERASYLEIVGDEDGMKTARESGISRKSSASEGSQEKNKAPAANANYTQLMPESGYAHLVP